MFKAMWGGAHYYEGETLFKDANDLPIYALMKVKFLRKPANTYADFHCGHHHIERERARGTAPIGILQGIPIRQPPC